jgi:hypothetical protein
LPILRIGWRAAVEGCRQIRKDVSICGIIFHEKTAGAAIMLDLT